MSENIHFRPNARAIDFLELILAVWIMAFGVILSVRSGLGTNPMVSLPCVISLMSGISLGTMTFIVYALLVVAQWIILRKKGLKRILMTLSQLPFTLLFSVFIDTLELGIGDWTLTDPVMQWSLLILSNMLIGLGIVFEVDANISLLADDGFVLAIHETTRVPMHKVLIIFDVVFVIVAFILSMLAFGGMYGVGVGTLLAMFLIGMFMKFFTKIVETYIRPNGHLA